MRKALLMAGLSLLPVLSGAETVSGRYVSEAKNDVSLYVKGANKISRPDKKGKFSVKNVNVATDTLVVKSPRFEHFVFLPLNGASTVVINEQSGLLNVNLKKSPYVPTAEYNGIILTKDVLERTGERMALAAVNVKVPRQNAPTTFNGNMEPLYFIDGQLTSDVSTVPLVEIAYAEVVRGSNAESAAMGARGANGMILLTTETKYRVDNPDWNAPTEFSMSIPVSMKEFLPSEKEK